MNVAEMLLTGPVSPAAIWGTLMLLSLPALVLLASPHGVSHPALAAREVVEALRERRRDRLRRRQHTIDLIRYADELRAAADNARRNTARWQSHWEIAGERVDATWRAWQDATARLDRATAAAAFRLPFAAPTTGELAARRTWLERALTAAVERGDLPADTNGWEPDLHPFDQELAILRAVAAHRWQQHLLATAQEKRAWHDVCLARRTGQDLLRQATAATRHAATLRPVTPTGPARRPTRTAIAVRTA